VAGKTVNDQIDWIFRGIVFILFSFLSSVLTLILNPRSGYLILLKREDLRDMAVGRDQALADDETGSRVGKKRGVRQLDSSDERE
jgi:hypothetical protein